MHIESLARRTTRAASWRETYGWAARAALFLAASFALAACSDEFPTPTEVNLPADDRGAGG